MNADEAVRRLTEVIRRKHLALATERTYCAWLRRYCDFLKELPLHLPSEHKLERFLTALAKKDVASTTQNQAFSAMVFFYKEALGTELKNVQALRARRPAQIRHAPTPAETRLLLKTIQSDAAFATSLAVRLLYGCGLRVTAFLNLPPHYLVCCAALRVPTAQTVLNRHSVEGLHVSLHGVPQLNAASFADPHSWGIIRIAVAIVRLTATPGGGIIPL